MTTLRHLLLLFLSFFWSSTALAERDNSNVCADSGLVFGFFNGVLTTPYAAGDALDAFYRIHGNRSVHGDSIRYELLHNYTKGFEDFVETFDQRLKEHEAILGGRFELFFEAIHGGGPWWDDLIAEVTSAADLLKSLVDWSQAQAINELTELMANPATTENYAEHKARIDTWLIEGNKLLFVAHSQGNLFANAAHDYAVGQSASESVALVHIAPASPTLRGDHTLADFDIVINGLRAVGQVPSITDLIPSYLDRLPGLNGQTDALGHGLLEIYLNPALQTSERVRRHIEEAMRALVAPESEASAGFFTVTLTWDGAGDVDLHTFEPAGIHVYYASREGFTGYLDVDNTSAHGPEHYFAACDQNYLQVGSYSVAVANYHEAEGRTATVQVATDRDGVLGTNAVQLGPETGAFPEYQLFEVIVEHDLFTGEYLVRLNE